jgi:hypothetical protein
VANVLGEVMRKIKYKLVNLKNGAYLVKFENNYDMNLTFLRAQEFQESPKWAGKQFTFVEFFDWYIREYQPETGNFTYASDWAGFNLPVETIRKVLHNFLGTREWNLYDQTMCNILGKIKEPKAYLISSRKYDKPRMIKTLKHELTHALYYLNDEYRDKVDVQIGNIKLSKWNKIKKLIIKKGYNECVVNDEFNAYITTDTGSRLGQGWFKDYEKDPIVKDIIATHKRYFKEFMGKKKVRDLI